jgi:hypothetical protein
MLYHRQRFRLVRFRSPLLTESLLISFPPGTKMFQFPGYCPLAGDHGSHDRVPPFGNRRINACLQLPVAYRSKPRPSSPIDALASPVRPLLLDHITLSTTHLCVVYICTERTCALLWYSIWFYGTRTYFRMSCLFRCSISTAPSTKFLKPKIYHLKLIKHLCVIFLLSLIHFIHYNITNEIL